LFCPCMSSIVPGAGKKQKNCAVVRLKAFAVLLAGRMPAGCFLLSAPVREPVEAEQPPPGAAGEVRAAAAVAEPVNQNQLAG